MLPDESGAVSIMHAHLLTPGFSFKFTDWKDHPCPTDLSVHSALSRFSVNAPSVHVYFHPRKGCIPGRVISQEGLYPRKGFIPGRVVPQEGFYPRKGCTPGRVISQEGLYPRKGFILKGCTPGRVVYQEGLHPRKGCIQEGLYPRKGCIPGRVFIPGRVVPQEGLYLRKGCTPGRVVPRTVAWVKPREASGLAPRTDLWSVFL